MARRKNKTLNSATALESLVTVAFAEDVDLAEQYKDLLNDNDIPAAVKTRPDPDSPHQGIAVLVPEDFLDEAHVLIEDRSSMADFYDIAFGEQDYDDTDQGFFNEE